MNKIPNWLYWTPRVLSILMLLFLTLFSLDVFEEGLGFWGTLLGLFMHNLPVIVLAIVLWISWKREIIAGIVFIVAGLLYMIQIMIRTLSNPFEWYMLSYSFIIAGPLIVIGVLFLVNWRRRKRKKRK